MLLRVITTTILPRSATDGYNQWSIIILAPALSLGRAFNQSEPKRRCPKRAGLWFNGIDILPQ